MITTLTKPQKDAFRETARRNFWFYFMQVFGAFYYCKDPKRDWVDVKRHQHMALAFERRIKWWMANRHTFTDRFIYLWMVPRRTGKSTEITSAGSSWCHLNDPNLTIGLGSYKDTKARDFLGPVKTMYEGESGNGLFKDLFGIWGPVDGQPWTDSELVHAARTMREIREPSYQCIGVKGGSVGSRYDMYFLDDPIADRSSKEISTQLETDCQAAVMHLRKMWPVIEPNGLIVIPCTRKADIDVAGYVMREFKVREFDDTMMGPREEIDYRLDPAKGRCFVYFMSGRDKDGTATFPKSWNEDAMDAFEQRDPVNFASEIMNMPAEGVHMALKREHFRWIRPSEVPRNLRFVLTCDTAFKTPDQVKKGDSNAICEAGHSRQGDGMIYVFRCLGSNLWSSKEFYDQLVMAVQFRLAQVHDIGAITDEKETGGKEGLFAEAYTAAFHKVGIPLPRLVTFKRQGKAKALRMSLGENYIQQGKVVFVEGGEGLKVLEHQLLRRGYTSHDDYADAFVDHFNPQVYQGENLNVNLPQVGRANRPMDPYLQTPLFAASTQDKVAAYKAMRDRAAAEERAKAEAPWWHNRAEV